MYHNFPSWEYKGYTYHGWDDVGDDVVKIWHDIKDPEGLHIDGPWSPYVVPTLEEFTVFCREMEDKRLKDDGA